VYLEFELNFNLNVYLPWSFQQVYVCLKAIKEGLINRYRPFIDINGCYLKGLYRGILLSTRVGCH